MSEETTSQPAPNPDPAAPPAAPEDWRTGLPEDVVSAIAPFKDVTALASGYASLAKKLGADKVVVPTQHSTPEEWSEFYGKLGRPESPDKYELPAAPEGFQVNEQFQSGFLGKAHELGLTNSQVAGLHQWHTEQVLQWTQASTQQQEAARTAAVEALRKEWGADYDKNVKSAASAFKAFADEQALAEIEQGLRNNPHLIRVFHRIASAMGESSMDEGNASGGMSPERAMKTINEIRGNPKHPYFDSRHPSHKDAVDEMHALHAIAYGTNPVAMLDTRRGG